MFDWFEFSAEMICYAIGMLYIGGVGLLACWCLWPKRRSGKPPRKSKVRATTLPAVPSDLQDYSPSETQ